MKFHNIIKQIPYYKEHPEGYRRNKWYFFPEDLDAMLIEFDRLTQKVKDNSHIQYIREIYIKRAHAKTYQLWRKEDFTRRMNEIISEIYAYPTSHT